MNFHCPKLILSSFWIFLGFVLYASYGKKLERNKKRKKDWQKEEKKKERKEEDRQRINKQARGKMEIMWKKSGRQVNRKENK